MSIYTPNIADMHFVLSKVLHSSNQLQRLTAFQEIDDDLMRQVLGEAAKFVGEVISPLNRDGDETGAQWKEGSVFTPAGFKEAYEIFWRGGWPALSASSDHGGQGLPSVLEAMLYEMLSAANIGWTVAPGLLHGAYECIRHHASDELKNLYLEKVATGEWLATMCLTEPHAGSDLGMARTKATLLPDGSYALSGTKIFISGGEHDLTDNIVHLVLARISDAPPGPKGLSLFLVPKHYPDGTRSPVYCERIEEKMGLHASPTCVMRFEDAKSWILGSPGKGLNAMFLMMNAARLHVALQGLGLLDAAWHKANAYALERRQMRRPGGNTPLGSADLIAEHPAIRRILDTQRAWIDAGRVLAYQTAIELDVIQHGDEPSQIAAQNWCALVTPIMKAAFTHQAFHGGSDCLQVFGGHGYIREWGMEQVLRDARVTMIYEGTNEIQAIDLLVRKVLPDQGARMNELLDVLSADLSTTQDRHQAALDRMTDLKNITRKIGMATPSNAQLPYSVAEDYLRASTLVLMEWAWLRIEACIDTLSPEESSRWIGPSHALRHWVLPEFQMRITIMEQQIRDVNH